MLLLPSCKDRHGGVVEGAADIPKAGLALPAFAPLGGNALRVFISPSFSDYDYLVDYAPQPKDCVTPSGGYADEVEKLRPRYCTDVLVTYSIFLRQGEKRQSVAARSTFHLPIEEWQFLTEGLDDRLDMWRGAALGVGDGTSATVERLHEGRLRSVQNNFATYAGPSNPAYFAQTETQRLLALYGPSGKVPRPTDWTVRREADPAWPCSNVEFATPDPDGWGVGNDPCAQRLQRK